ncbi:MAG: carbon monoxide dehydrogenase subunit G [Rhizobiaceae bacterium]|nr:carbon monoxide dehydrogenase subunit G [Hyphomicrobiales bacterium]NRB31643.1 carbon monoxide dehydrogenase subunit G [Rhizobiaceae bacterium]
MDLSDEIFIKAPQDVVYAGLNDPEILKQCIPGCEELIKHSDTELEAKVVLRVGPVKAKFGGNVVLDPSNAPGGFSLSGEGNGGLAGFAKGGADVELEEQDGGTLLRYTAKVEIGGKLAQLGSRLVTSTANKLSKKFFEQFKEAVT